MALEDFERGWVGGTPGKERDEKDESLRSEKSQLRRGGLRSSFITLTFASWEMHGSQSGFENVEPGTGWLMQVDTSAISASSGSPFWTTCTCVDVSEMALSRPDNTGALKWPTTWVLLLVRVCMKIELDRNDLIPRKPI